MKSRPKIMVVDDEPTVLELVREVLESNGYIVVTTMSGEECLKKLKRSGVDLVLLDIMMPDLSGWSVYKRIRRKYKDMKVAFMSVLEFSSPEKREMLKRSGLSEFLGKPFSPEDLLRKIRIILED